MTTTPTAATSTTGPQVGDRVTYHGSKVVAHGEGEIIAVRETGRVDIRVTELTYGLAWWAEVPFELVRNVRPQSYTAARDRS